MTSWKAKVSLHRRDVAEILDALAEMRDHTGEEAGPLEDRLQSMLHRFDRQVAERKTTTKGTR